MKVLVLVSESNCMENGLFFIDPIQKKQQTKVRSRLSVNS